MRTLMCWQSYGMGNWGQSPLTIVFVLTSSLHCVSQQRGAAARNSRFPAPKLTRPALPTIVTLRHDDQTPSKAGEQKPPAPPKGDPEPAVPSGYVCYSCCFTYNTRTFTRTVHSYLMLMII